MGKILNMAKYMGTFGLLYSQSFFKIIFVSKINNMN